MYRAQCRYLAIQSLPLELLYAIFENLDRTFLRACMFTCRNWYPVSGRLLYRNPVFSSKSTMDAFIRAITFKGDLRDSVRDLHIRGKANYSSAMHTDWILQIPSRLATLLPNVRSITFENVEAVYFRDHFWTSLEGFRKVTELNIKACRFSSGNDVQNMIFSFPSLTALTLSHVVWGTSVMNAAPERWNRVLPLRKLELDCLRGVGEYADALRWVYGSQNVRELTLVHIPPAALVYAGRYLAAMRGSLESLTLSPLILFGRDLDAVPHITAVLHSHSRLETLRLQIIDAGEAGMSWVYRVLDAVEHVPIRRVSLDFTLDVANAHRLSAAWDKTNTRLSMNWPQTLERVTLTHHPVGNFVADETVAPILRAGLPALVSRGLLDVKLGLRYLDR